MDYYKPTQNMTDKEIAAWWEKVKDRPTPINYQSMKERAFEALIRALKGTKGLSDTNP